MVILLREKKETFQTKREDNVHSSIFDRSPKPSTRISTVRLTRKSETNDYREKNPQTVSKASTSDRVVIICFSSPKSLDLGERVVILLREETNNAPKERIKMTKPTTSRTLELVEELIAAYPTSDVGLCVEGGDFLNTVCVEGGDLRGAILFWEEDGVICSSWNCY